MTTTVDLLADILSNRKGGIEALKGFKFQFQYALLRLLTDLNEDNSNHIIIDGIEDIDLYNQSPKTHNFFQLKSSNTKIDASYFVDKDILKNFLEVYLDAPDNLFFLISNAQFAKGKLLDIKNLSHKGVALPASAKVHWETKCNRVRRNNPDWNWSNFDVTDFLSKIRFQTINNTKIIKDIDKNLIQHLQRLDSKTSNKQQYLNSLITNSIQWSISRKKITYDDIKKVFLNVKQDIASGSINRAIKQNWITPVSFAANQQKDFTNYYDGQPAKPLHIAQNLPISRVNWEKEIISTIHNFDVTVIQASSGQGKSTLAWCVSQQLQNKPFRVYELSLCKKEEDVGELYEFINDRILLGEIPLIVIDGLNNNVRVWHNLVTRTANLPVKYLVTSREEEWFEFGSSSLTIKIKHISIFLGLEEARKIYQKLKKNHRIALKNVDFQTVWETTNGLLIEYIFYLTQGQMLADRLKQQIANINNKKEHEKLAILKLVAVANVCQVKIKTTQLAKHIKSEFGSQANLNNSLQGLENEYQIHLQNKNYIEGLHLVRSQHIIDITHSSIPISETLKLLLNLIDEDDLFTFCSLSMQFLQTLDEQTDFLAFLANSLKSSPYDKIVAIIKGIYSADAKQFWLVNKEIFDELYRGKGGLIYALDLLPWSKPIFKPLVEAKALEGDDSSKKMLQYYENIKEYNPNESNGYLLVRQLFENFINEKLNTNLKGFRDLLLWFNKYTFEFPLLDELDLKKLEYNRKLLSLKEFGNLLSATYHFKKDVYEAYYAKNKTGLISYLKEQTKTVTVDFQDEAIHIEYLTGLEGYEDLNNQSMERIEIASLLFPNYNIFQTQAIYPPFSFVDYLTNGVYDPSYKRIKRDKWLIDKHTQDTNSIWLARISENYEWQSLYEWQAYIIKIRKQGVALISLCNKMIELALSKQNNTVMTTARAVDKKKDRFIEITQNEKKTKSESILSEKFAESLTTINSWLSSLENLINQLIPKDDDEWVTFMANLISCQNKLIPMQVAFDDIVNNTMGYFNDEIKSLISNEKKYFDIFEKTMSFYQVHKNNLQKLSKPKEEIRSWYKESKTQKLMGLHKELNQLEVRLKVTLIPPKYILEDEAFSTAVIGVYGLTPDEFVKITDLFLILLIDLKETNIDYFIFVLVNKDNKAMQNVGVQIPKSFLQELSEIEDDNSELTLGPSKPLPVPITAKHIHSNPEISLNNESHSLSNDVNLEILINIWKLDEIQKRLTTPSEEQWKKTLVNNIFKELNKNLLTDDFLEQSQETQEKYRKLVNNAKESTDEFDIEEIEQLFQETILSDKEEKKEVSQIEDLFNVNLHQIPDETFTYLGEELNSSGMEIKRYVKSLIVPECSLFYSVEVIQFPDGNKNIIFEGEKNLPSLIYLEELVNTLYQLFGEDTKNQGLITFNEKLDFFEDVSIINRDWSNPTIRLSLISDDISLVLFSI
jgi:hypothetical protein